MSGTETFLLAAMAIFVLLVAFILIWGRWDDRGGRKTEPASTRRTVEVIELTLSPGAVFSKWCDECNRTHLWVTIYAYEGDDPTAARPIGITAVPDDYEDQDGGRDA